MAVTAQFVPTSFSLAAVFAWGTSDFLGGYAARRTNAFLLTSIAHASGLLLMLVLATATHAQIPSERSVVWAIAGGVSGGGALALFYRALASGRMGLTAPVAAVLGAAVPTVFGMAAEGVPGTVHLAGFVIAAAGIWLISRSEDGSGTNKGIGLAAISGIGFAGFYLCISQARNGSALWLAVWSRIGAIAVTGTIVLLRHNFHDITRAAARCGVLAGCLDVSGTALFVRASQTGRLDSAVVLTSLYPAITVLLARFILHEHFTRWKLVGLFAALLAVPMIASG